MLLPYTDPGLDFDVAMETLSDEALKTEGRQHLSNAFAFQAEMLDHVASLLWRMSIVAAQYDMDIICTNGHLVIACEEEAARCLVDAGIIEEDSTSHTEEEDDGITNTPGTTDLN